MTNVGPYALIPVRVYVPLLEFNHVDTGIDADLAPLWLTGEAAELLPAAHLPQAVFGQVGQPVIEPRVGFGPVPLVVVARQVSQQPLIGL